jgi:type III secretion system FlhB-like substrate exporter
MTDRVVGMSYDPAADAVPTVILKGAGAEAHEIVARARQLGDVPIVKDPQLVRELYRLPLDAPIGRELFPVMAAVLAHVVRLDRLQESRGDKPE